MHAISVEGMVYTYVISHHTKFIILKASIMFTNKLINRTLILLAFVLSFQLSAQAQQLSDAAIKTNIAPIENSLNIVKQLEPKSFEYNTSAYSHLKLPQGTRFGFVAEDFQRVLPGLVFVKPYSFTSGKNATRNTSIKTVDMESLVPILIASIKEQQLQIDQLKAEVERLKAK